MSLSTPHYLIVPGWQGSPAEHWQSHWQRLLPNSARVEQDDWLSPQRDAWVRRLEETVARSSGPLILIGHSLGCVTIAHWAAQAAPALLARVGGALLVAPADVERAECPQPLRNFAPLPRQALPFPSVLVGSDNDPAASASRASALGAGLRLAVPPAAAHRRAGPALRLSALSRETGGSAADLARWRSSADPARNRPPGRRPSDPDRADR